MSTRHKGIIAYGTDADRQKLAMLADAHRCSGSEFIIKMIRERYASIFEVDYGEYLEKVPSGSD